VTEFEPGNEVRLLHNSVASKWVDVSNLIQSGDVDAYLDGKEANNSFLEALKMVNDDQPEVGISWRWIVGIAADSLSLELCLQALPCNESTIKVSFSYLLSLILTV